MTADSCEFGSRSRGTGEAQKTSARFVSIFVHECVTSECVLHLFMKICPPYLTSCPSPADPWPVLVLWCPTCSFSSSHFRDAVSCFRPLRPASRSALLSASLLYAQTHSFICHPLNSDELEWLENVWGASYSANILKLNT